MTQYTSLEPPLPNLPICVNIFPLMTICDRFFFDLVTLAPAVVVAASRTDILGGGADTDCLPKYLKSWSLLRRKLGLLCAGRCSLWVLVVDFLPGRIAPVLSQGVIHYPFGYEKGASWHCVIHMKRGFCRQSRGAIQVQRMWHMRSCLAECNSTCWAVILEHSQGSSAYRRSFDALRARWSVFSRRVARSSNGRATKTSRSHIG
ncbi:hypothetical protein KC322_g6 [Hortaea werneckii]|nr:hypothetical protein KC322_g6 [Hortaea werneckii]